MKPFAFRGALDPRCNWTGHKLPCESNSGRAERLLRRLENETPPRDIPITERKRRSDKRLLTVVRVSIDIRDDRLIEMIYASQKEWGYRSASTAFRRLLIQACSFEPEIPTDPDEALRKYPIGETISAEDWATHFHCLEYAATAAAILAKAHKVKLIFGGKLLHVPRGFTSAQNPISAIVRLPEGLTPVSGKRKKPSYLYNGLTLPAFTGTELLRILFRPSSQTERDQLRSVVDRNGAIILQSSEIPIAVIVSQDCFIRHASVETQRMDYLSLEGMTYPETVEIFFQAIVTPLKERQICGMTLDITGLGAIVITRLDLFSLKALSDPQSDP